MKKILKSRIFTIIITTIVVASGTLYAATLYNATDISYKPSSGESMNVNEALDDLYAKSKENDDKYKVYSFTNEDATVSGTHADYTDGKWITMTYQKTTNCKSNVCDYEGGYVSFEIDLGFTPSEVSNAQVYLSTSNSGYGGIIGKELSNYYGFYYSRGFAQNSNTYQYWYTRSLIATYPVRYIKSPLSDNADSCETNEDGLTCSEDVYGTIYGAVNTTAGFTYTTVEISGSKLIFKVNIDRRATTNGTTNSAYKVRTLNNKFYLSGTIVYK